MSKHGDLDAENGCSNHHTIRQLNDVEIGPQFGWLADLTSRAKVVFRLAVRKRPCPRLCKVAG